MFDKSAFEVVPKSSAAMTPFMRDLPQPAAATIIRRRGFLHLHRFPGSRMDKPAMAIQMAIQTSKGVEEKAAKTPPVDSQKGPLSLGGRVGNRRNSHEESK